MVFCSVVGTHKQICAQLDANQPSPPHSGGDEGFSRGTAADAEPSGLPHGRSVLRRTHELVRNVSGKL
jgi:hypothetical protein